MDYLGKSWSHLFADFTLLGLCSFVDFYCSFAQLFNELEHVDVFIPSQTVGFVFVNAVVWVLPVAVYYIYVLKALASNKIE